MGLRLVQKRGQLMGEADGGTMAAVLGIREDALRTLLHDNGLDTIDLANLNSPTQIVIAGDTAAIATIASPVLWTDSIRYLMEQGDFTYTEIGADPKRTGGSVLSKLVDEIRLDQPSSPGLTSVPLAVTWHCLNEDSMDIKNQNHFAELDQIILEIFDRQPLDAQPHYVADIDCGDGSLLRRVYEVVSTRTARGRSFNTYPLTLIGAVHNEQVLTATEKILQGLPHILVRGDVSHPKEWMDSLTAAGIPGLDNILHVHSFLCEERPCLSLAHLRHWKVHLSRFGLVLLEMHSPRTELAECLDSMVGQVCSDAASAFAGKTKVKASTFLMAAAENGLFPRTGAPRRLSKTADGAQVGLYHLMPKSYVIRHPRAEDWPHLVQVDRISQPEHLWTSRAELERRVKDLAQHSMVLEVAGNIVGALYAQRTDAIEPLKGCRHDELTPLYQAQGRYVQLLGLYIVPASHGHGHSDALIDCMLSYATALDGVRAVLGITRCADFVLHRQEFNLEQYVQIRNEHGQPLDPMLYFHVSHGANLHGPVPGYRPEDTDNQGAGVLIEYCLQSMAESGASHARPAPRSIEPPQIVQLVSDTVLQVLGEERAAAYDDQVPLMSMGLTSLELLKLRRLLSDRINQPLEATFFFRCGTPQAVIEELAAQMSFSATLPFSNTLPQQEALSDKMAFKVTPSETIAIVGMACRLPGGVRSPEQFWQLLSEERDTVGPLSEPRRKLAQETGQALRWPSAFVEDVDGFDAGFFRISPHEAEWLDPQQRLLLEVGWETLESAAIAPASLRGSRSGVFVGIMGSDYEALLRRNATDKGVEAHFATGSACSVAAGRLSYFLDWHGPALAIDTACSSSLVAVHTACRSLLGGECDLALATGVNLLLDDVRFEAYERAGMLSPEGHCKTFDAAADGYVRGEGCAAVLLKRLGDAQAASDRILGIIRGSAINQDGSSTGLTAPNQLAQQAVIEAALAQSKVAPHEVSYLEAHGTGTKLGDPIEVMAAAEVLGQGRSNHMPLWIGSVKSVIGHLEAAAGIAGLLKTVLAIRYGQLPAQRHYERPNPHIPWERLPVRVVAQAQTWPAGRKVAGVSSFGFSGTNAHVVVEEYVALQQAQTPSDGLVLVVLSARNEERLKAQAEQLLLHLARHKENLVDLAYTLQVGREAMGRRLALVVPTLESLKDKLIVYGAGDRTPEVGYFGQVKSEKQALKLLGGKETVTQIRRDKVTQGKLDEIAAGWVQGLSVDWTQLYGEVKPRRLNLPTYSFAPERYWIPKAELDASRPTLVSSGQQLSAGQPEQMQHLLEKQTPANPEVPLSTEQGLCLGRKHLVGLNGLDLTQCVVQDLTEQVAQLLKLPSEMLEPETNLAEYGVDSIVLTGFRQKLNARYNLTLSRAVFFEALTIMQLSVVSRTWGGYTNKV
ncbi:hypothetical protein BGZ96_002980 [Linnemannia gamsii]|uniref:Polyketide synthase n=1 Tax=Linnemannia gamsii TaxID=64522 RepID=A0ABQ7KFZ5_9FUNG|nr:hypothetical protein BGZ96_002980 [Linnemannia gamsii]